MAREYKIGLNHAGLAYFSAIAVPMPDPRGEAMDYAQPTDLGDGTKRGLGWLQQTWHWGFLTEAQRNHLHDTYTGKTVNVLTRKNDGTFAEYTALFTWPENEPEHYANRVIDITITLRKLTAVT